MASNGTRPTASAAAERREDGAASGEEKRVMATSADVSPSTTSVAAGDGTATTWPAKIKSFFALTRSTPRRVWEDQPEDAKTIRAKIWTFFKFLGPGAIISVAYVDPDNYQTAISSGATFQYKLLFMVLVSNIIAIYLQSLCVKVGTVTGLDLAQMNHRHLPRWLELFVYAIAEACIICTDLGQVIGTAISLNILIPRLPLPAACVISVAETLLILLFYSPTGQLRRIRAFEIFVALLVAALFVTICVALAQISAPAGPVFRGYVPSREIFVNEGLYDSCALLGGTLMPHAIYVGTSLSRARLYDYDNKHDNLDASDEEDANAGSAAAPTANNTSPHYRPTLRAIKNCLNYSIAELCFTLFSIAIFVNSALIILSGAAFYQDPSADAGSGGGDDDDDDDNNIVARTLSRMVTMVVRRDDDDNVGGGGSGNSTSGSNDDSGGFNDDLYALYDLFSSKVSPGAAVLFAVSLLFSGISAGIVATMAGQIVMEGALNIRIHPFVRRLITRCIAIIPALIIAVSVGKDGLSQALVACNYVLAIGLIFITFPLVWYTTFDKYMTVPADDGTGFVSLRNNIPTSVIAWLIWLLVVVMDIATIVLIGLGLTDAG